MAQDDLRSVLLSLTPKQVDAELEKLDGRTSADDAWRGWRQLEAMGAEDLRRILRIARLYVLKRCPGLQNHGDLEVVVAQSCGAGREQLLTVVEEWVTRNVTFVSASAGHEYRPSSRDWRRRSSQGSIPRRIGIALGFALSIICVVLLALFLLRNNFFSGTGSQASAGRDSDGGGTNSVSQDCPEDEVQDCRLVATYLTPNVTAKGMAALVARYGDEAAASKHLERCTVLLKRGCAGIR